jgi:integrase
MGIYQRTIELRGGQLKLYTRPDDPQGFWHCRFKLEQANKFIRRSLKTTDLNDARRMADNLFDELRFKDRNGERIRQIRFGDVASDYDAIAERETREGRLSKGRLGFVRGTIRRYMLPFFGKRALEEITPALLAQYDEWRLDYWKSGPGSLQRKPNSKTVPSSKTLMMEQGVLRQILKYAVETGQLDHLPYMKAKRAKTNRRSAFAVGEYLALIRAARRRAQYERHPRVRRDRLLLELYIRLMIGTGMRVGEARLWVNGKTGRRAVIGSRTARLAVKKLLAFYGHATLAQAQENALWVFTNAKGKRIDTFEVAFKGLIGHCNLTVDRYGQGRTLYCLRHSYATYRLQYGGTDVYLLAKNMGTSVQMIESHYGHVNTTLAASRLI